MDVQYFIDKFEAIPEEKWCIGIQVDEEGRRCALGHFLPKEYINTRVWLNAPSLNGYSTCGAETKEGRAMCILFPGGAHGIARINNGYNIVYQQPTPKQRILAALRDIQSNEREAKGDQTLALIKWEPEEGEWGPENEEKGNPFEEESAGPYAPGAFSMKWEPEDDELEDEEVEIEVEVPSEC